MAIVSTDIPPLSDRSFAASAGAPPPHQRQLGPGHPHLTMAKSVRRMWQVWSHHHCHHHHHRRRTAPQPMLGRRWCRQPPEVLSVSDEKPHLRPVRRPQPACLQLCKQLRRRIPTSKQLQVQRRVESQRSQRFAGSAGCSRRHRDRAKRLLDWQGAAGLGGGAGDVCRSAGAAAAVRGRRLEVCSAVCSLSLSLIMRLLMPRRRVGSGREVKHEREHEDEGRRRVEQPCAHSDPTCRESVATLAFRLCTGPRPADYSYLEHHNFKCTILSRHPLCYEYMRVRSLLHACVACHVRTAHACVHVHARASALQSRGQSSFRENSNRGQTVF